MATESVTMDGDDVGVYGLLSGFCVVHVDAVRNEARVFADMDTGRLAATANRADNVVEGASSALRAVGDLLMAHDPKVAPVPSMDVGSAVVMLADLLDGARLVAANARHELELRAGDRPLHVAEG